MEKQKKKNLSAQNFPQDAHQFLDIQEINGIPFMFLYHDDETNKNIWLCLNIPKEMMNWNDGLRWCQLQGACYGEIPTLKFILERLEQINVVLEANGYPLVEDGWYWSDESSDNGLWALGVSNCGVRYGNKKNRNCVKAVLSN